MHRILLVEDDMDLAGMVAAFLADEGFDVAHVSNGPDAVDAILATEPDLVLLDVMLPGVNGIEVVRSVRPDFIGLILMLTAKDDDITEINALNRGADAFLEKPVRPHVLLAHIHAHLRRHENIRPDVIRVHDLTIDKGRHEVAICENRIDLTTHEFELLTYLAERPGVVISRENLYLSMRGIDYDGVDRAMDMRISTLRSKLGDDRPPYKYIKTVRGKGYLLSR